MRNDTERFLQYRKAVDSAMQANFPIFIRDSPFHDWAIGIMTDMIKQRIGGGRPDLEELFIPKFSPGCRRNTVRGLLCFVPMYHWRMTLICSSFQPGDGFLEALTQDRKDFSLLNVPHI